MHGEDSGAGVSSSATTLAALDLYRRPGKFIDSTDPDVQAFAHKTIAATSDAVSCAVKLFYAVRDEILYDPYYVGEAPCFFRASDCLRAGRGFCVPKAALLAAAARAVGIPARVGYADVRNHLCTKKLLDLVGGNLFVWHGFTEFNLAGRWIKATPAFNVSLCERFGVRPLEFDGRHDALFHEYDRAGRRHMEYVRERGDYPDVPYETIITDFKRAHPRWLALRASRDQADFAREAATEIRDS